MTKLEIIQSLDLFLVIAGITAFVLVIIFLLLNEFERKEELKKQVEEI